MVIAPIPGSHIAKRQSILETAAAVFCREGYGGANIDMIAAEAGVSRQTVYNNYRDKETLFRAVVAFITERSNAVFFETLSTFPDHPQDLEADLLAFAMRLSTNCICSREGKHLRRMIQNEGERYPELFASWRQDGPNKVWSALAARFARLAYAGYLDIADPDVAARQFLALNHADLQVAFLLGDTLGEDQIRQASTHAVQAFLRAYGRKKAIAPRLRAATAA